MSWECALYRGLPQRTLYRCVDELMHRERLSGLGRLYLKVLFTIMNKNGVGWSPDTHTHIHTHRHGPRLLLAKGQLLANNCSANYPTSLRDGSHAQNSGNVLYVCVCISVGVNHNK